MERLAVRFLDLWQRNLAAWAMQKAAMPEKEGEKEPDDPEVKAS